MEALNKADEAKSKRFSNWSDFIPKIFVAWFILISADVITGTHLVAKYFVLIGGMYSTWFSLIDVSLFGQRASFVRNSRKHANRLLKRNFCYLQIVEDCFIDKNGLTKFYISTTREQINQHINILVILFLAVLFSIFQDLYPIVLDLF